MSKRNVVIIGLILALVLMVSCAPSGPARTSGGVAGFWKGLWHGFILLFTAILSLFRDDVGVYEMNNSGHMYNIGFLLGVMAFFGGSSGGACSKSKNICK